MVTFLHHTKVITVLLIIPYVLYTSMLAQVFLTQDQGDLDLL